jgi:hypothetical protein
MEFCRKKKENESYDSFGTVHENATRMPGIDDGDDHGSPPDRVGLFFFLQLCDEIFLSTLPFASPCR